MHSVAILLIGLAAIPAETAGTPIVRGDLAARVDGYVSRLVPFGFSGILVVAKNDEMIVLKGYGVADRERHRPVTPDTVFPVGSITKQFTAAAVLTLEAKGKLSVTDPLSKYIPGDPPDKAGITLHHLLTHTAGLDSDYGTSDFEPVSRDEIIRRVFAAPLRSEPGKRYQYSNAGYSLLAAVIELVCGQSYETYLNENLFRSAGMTKTGYRMPNWPPDTIAQGYRGGARWGTILEKPWAADGPYWNLRGNGGIHSTAGDMFLWHRALEGDAILPAAERVKLFKPYVPEPGGDTHYGYGWSIRKSRRGTRVVEHNGGDGIYFADYRRYPDDGLMYFVASNVAEFSAITLSPRIESILLGGEPRPIPEVTKADPNELARYAGSYRLGGGGTFRVTPRDGGLDVSSDDVGALVLLRTGRPADKSLADTDKRTASILAAQLKGDLGPLHEALGKSMSLDNLRSMVEGTRKELETQHGRLKDFTVLGTMRDRPERVTLVRLQFEHGSVIVRYAWGPRRLLGMRIQDDAPVVRMLPHAPSEFVILEPSTLSAVTVRFRGDGPNAGEMAIAARDGEVVARKVD